MEAADFHGLWNPTHEGSSNSVTQNPLTATISVEQKSNWISVHQHSVAFLTIPLFPPTAPVCGIAVQRRGRAATRYAKMLQMPGCQTSSMMFDPSILGFMDVPSIKMYQASRQGEFTRTQFF